MVRNKIQAHNTFNYYHLFFNIKLLG